MSIVKEVSVVLKQQIAGKSTIVVINSYKLADLDKAVVLYKSYVAELKVDQSVELVTDFVL